MDLPSAFHHEPCHFGSKIIIRSDVTVTVRIRFSSFFLQKSIMSALEIRLAKFEVVRTNICRVWTCLVHFSTNFVILESKVTSQWQSEPNFWAHWTLNVYAFRRKVEYRLRFLRYFAEKNEYLNQKWPKQVDRKKSTRFLAVFGLKIVV